MDRLSRWLLPSEDHAVAIARRHLQAVGADLPEDLLESALLATSELVTNAVRHGAGEVVLVVRTSPATLRVEVHDRGANPAALQTNGHDGKRGGGHGAATQHRDWQSEGGRGLVIVDALARQWGVIVTEQPPGKSVWFEMTPAT